jgi:hypothetical protein
MEWRAFHEFWTPLCHLFGDFRCNALADALPSDPSLTSHAVRHLAILLVSLFHHNVRHNTQHMLMSIPATGP